MNSKHFDRIILKKLKSRCSETKSPPSVQKKKRKPTIEGLASLLSEPILINLDDLFVESQCKTSEKNKQKFNCDGKPKVTSHKKFIRRSKNEQQMLLQCCSDGKPADEQSNSCDVTISSTSSEVNACGDVVNRSFVTSSVLNVSNVSADSGVGLFNDSISAS